MVTDGRREGGRGSGEIDMHASGVSRGVVGVRNVLLSTYINIAQVRGKWRRSGANIGKERKERKEQARGRGIRVAKRSSE